VPAHRRDQLERLSRSTARSAVSLERLEADEGGALLSTFTRPWSEGTTGIPRSPWELLETLAARVPLPRRHLMRYGGYLAPPSPRRRLLLPPPPRQPGLAVPAVRAVRELDFLPFVKPYVHVSNTFLLLI
jgi:hypothetical protein